MTKLGSAVTNLAALAEIAAGESDLDRRAQLEVLRRHFQAEFFDLDIDALMGTMVDEPRFAYYGMGEPSFLSGFDVVRDHYLVNFRAGADQVGIVIEGIAVGRDLIAIEGTSVMTKDFVEAFLPGLAEAANQSPEYVVKKRTCSLFPFRGGLMAGETLYFDGPYTEADIVAV